MAKLSKHKEGQNALYAMQKKPRNQQGQPAGAKNGPAAESQPEN